MILIFGNDYNRNNQMVYDLLVEIKEENVYDLDFDD